MYNFGPGFLYGTPTTANATPRKFGAVQDIAVEFSATIKQLFGQSRYALALAAGQTKGSIKGKFANLNGGIFNDLFFGQTLVTGSVATVIAETAAVPTTPFQITVLNSANFVTDLGVYDVTAAKALTKVASAPATGQYAAAAGVYTFAAADTTHSMAIDYTYAVSATGGKIVIANQIAGVTPVFQVVHNGQFQGKACTYTFNNCASEKLMLPTKMDDYVISELDIVVSADASGTIGTLAWGDAA